MWEPIRKTSSHTTHQEMLTTVVSGHWIVVDWSLTDPLNKIKKSAGGGWFIKKSSLICWGKKLPPPAHLLSLFMTEAAVCCYDTVKELYQLDDRQQKKRTSARKGQESAIKVTSAWGEINHKLPIAISSKQVSVFAGQSSTTNSNSYNNNNSEKEKKSDWSYMKDKGWSRMVMLEPLNGEQHRFAMMNLKIPGKHGSWSALNLPEWELLLAFQLVHFFIT